jgi:hypothetical protein
VRARAAFVGARGPSPGRSVPRPPFLRARVSAWTPAPAATAAAATTAPAAAVAVRAATGDGASGRATAFSGRSAGGGPSSAAASASARCSAVRPVPPCSIWVRQLKPSASTSASGALSRTAGSTPNSPIFMDSS